MLKLYSICPCFELLFTLLPCPTLAEVTTYLGGRGEVLTANSQTIYFIRVTIYPVALAQKMSRGTLQDLLPCFGLYQSHFLP
jgi:hypothetical protein